jgi:putative chitinase
MNWLKRIFAPAPEVKMSVPDPAITAKQLDAIFPGRGDWAVWLDAAMQRYAITTPRRVAHFLAQVGHESNGLTVTEEDLFYRTAGRIQAVWPRRFATEAEAARYVRDPEALANLVYGGRRDLGNVKPGDGYAFRGRGLIQTTGRRNFTRLAEVFGFDAPEAAAAWAATREGAVMSAGLFWADNRLNDLADQGAGEMVESITLRVNGGRNGLADRRAIYARAAAVLEAWPGAQN